MVAGDVRVTSGKQLGSSVEVAGLIFPPLFLFVDRVKFKITAHLWLGFLPLSGEREKRLHPHLVSHLGSGFEGRGQRGEAGVGL